MNIGVIVANKIATGDGTIIVCGNSDYTVNFTFDSEWGSYETKTMRVQEQGGKYEDVVFTGTSAELPVLIGQTVVHIGVFAGDLHTTTPACFRCRPSILCKGGSPAKPSDDVYAQLMERMAQIETPDWNQNVPTAKDYIENRTHWSEFETMSIEGKRVKFGYVGAGGEKHGIQLPFALGQVWDAEFTGYTTYKGLEVKQADDGTLYIGDISFSPIPFCITQTASASNSAWHNVYGGRTLTLVGVSGTFVEETVHVLEEKYIPQEIARKKDFAANKVIIKSVASTEGGVNIGAEIADARKAMLLLVTNDTVNRIQVNTVTISSAEHYIILSCETGELISRIVETPRVCMVCVLDRDAGVCACINPYKSSG